MFLDSTLEFDPAGTDTTTDRASTNQIDLGVARDMAPGEQLYLLVLVGTTFTTGASGTLTVTIEGSTDNVTYTIYAATRAIAAAALVAGRQVMPFTLPRPAPGDALPRYLRLNYDVGSTMSAGKLGAWLVLGRDDIQFYPRNFVA